MTTSSLVRITIALVICMAFLIVPAAPAQAAAPTVTNISPSTGKAGDAVTLTIDGTGFLLAQRVRISDSNNDIVNAYLPNFIINSDTRITISFTIPADAAPGEARTRIYDASTYGNSYYGFSVLGPYIDSFVPGNAKQGQTLSVVLTGSGFTGATAVSFSGTGITVTGFNVDSDTQITAAVTVAADATLGDGHISVTTPDGTGTTSGHFRIFVASSPGWVIETVDTGTSNGFEEPSIAMDSSNRPHISYYDSDNENLKYARYNGTAWVKETVDSEGSVGSFSSLKLDGSGNPRIAYYDAINYALKFARWTGSAWENMTVDHADSADGVGYNGISLALDGAGCPHIAYYDKNNLTLKYASNISNPFNPASWVTETVPDVSGGLGCSLALDSGGDAHISYHRDWYSVYYVYQSGGTWQAPLQVNTGRGYYPSLALDSGGSPHISYGADDGIIRYASNPSSWIIREVQSTDMGGAHSSLALDGTSSQYAHIFYYDQITNFLGYASDNGTTFPYQVVEGGIFPNVGSLALDGNNKPHVAYPGSPATLKHAYYSGGTEPAVTAINPSSGTQGQTLSVTITGTNFTNPSTVAFSGTGITVNNVTFGSTTQLTANITISGSAATTVRDVTVNITGGGTGTKSSAFTVIAASPAKAITAFNFNALNPAVVGSVNEANKTIALTVPSGTNVTALVPTITFTGTAVNPASGVANNFTGPQTYTVTAANASTQAYTVTVTVAVNQSIGTGGQTSHGGSGAGSTSTTTTQPVSLPNIQPQSASLSAATVTPGTPVTVTVSIANKSAVNGNKKVTLYVNGRVETTQGITVNGGGSTQLTFTVSRSEPGNYMVYVDGVPAGSFKVELFRESDIILIFSISMLAMAFMIGMIMLWRRQQSAY